MFLLNHMPPEKATGKIKEIYSIFPEGVEPPHPLQLMSSSPGFMACQFEFIKYYSSHPKLSHPLLASIRYMAADDCDYAHCVEFNQRLLKTVGATEKDLEAIKNDPDNSPLEDNERALLKFVAKAIKTPAAVEAADVEELRNLGWDDPDILDAVAHGSFMQGHGILMKAFANK
ncbi:MAG: hypothetical protein GY874_01545 [Desulfobacteraceae bacterium]|nr:hypothetical protein [Desulfobacteraceae bacterium]